MVHCARPGRIKLSSKMIWLHLIILDEFFRPQSHNALIYSSSVRTQNWGHTVVAYLHYVQQTSARPCGYCAHSCGSGYVYSLDCVHPYPPTQGPATVQQCLSDENEGTWGIPHIPLSALKKATNQVWTWGKWLRNGSAQPQSSENPH